MRVVGIDVGTRRVGLALADPLRLFAQPWGTFSPDEALAALEQVQARDGVAVLVVGWPLTETGEAGKATERVAQYLRRLRKQLPHAEVVRWDERYTSELAKEQLRATATRRKHRRDKSRVDTLAAALILQEYLDQREPTR
jgi:putative Holliday junction resolvase